MSDQGGKKALNKFCAINWWTYWVGNCGRHHHSPEIAGNPLHRWRSQPVVDRLRFRTTPLPISLPPPSVHMIQYFQQSLGGSWPYCASESAVMSQRWPEGTGKGAKSESWYPWQSGCLESWRKTTYPFAHDGAGGYWEECCPRFSRNRFPDHRLPSSLKIIKETAWEEMHCRYKQTVPWNTDVKGKSRRSCELHEWQTKGRSYW